MRKLTLMMITCITGLLMGWVMAYAGASQTFDENVAIKLADSAISGFSFIYNPVGEILAAVARPNVSGYIDRGHMLEGLRRLAMLKILSSRENVAPKNMQRFLDAHMADYGNPYTGASMNWDGKRNSIFFKQLGDEKLVEVFM